MAGFAKIFKELEKQRKAAEADLERIDRAIAALGVLAGRRRRGRPPGRRRRSMSLATRKKMAVAARKRWARLKAKKTKAASA